MLCDVTGGGDHDGREMLLILVYAFRSSLPVETSYFWNNILSFIQPSQSQSQRQREPDMTGLNLKSDGRSPEPAVLAWQITMTMKAAWLVSLG